ncbi:MAG: DUF4346 domain-containing protein [Planctomycetota bacterium]|jgi:tetrahydromethanopterin S-methyltransferase subunit A
MKEALENICSYLSSLQAKNSLHLLENIQRWLKQMEPIKYTCFGCDYCFAATAVNIFNEAFPEMAQAQSLNCTFEMRERTWPPVPGEYFAFCEGTTCPVAVSTLASIELAERLAHAKPEGLCIVGKTATENIGIDKVIKNVITNPSIRFLVVAGKDPQGHRSGKTLLALSARGVDGDMKVIDAPGRRPILKNVCLSEVESFRRQVDVLNMIGCEDPKMIINKIDELSKKVISTCECKKHAEPISSDLIPPAPKILASEPKKFKMDKAGYFVVIPSPKQKIIIVEHYDYDNKLIHTVEGKDAATIYSTIIENEWITELSHAAYLGKELAKAEISLKHRFKYIQDKAAGRVEDNTK